MLRRFIVAAADATAIFALVLTVAVLSGPNAPAQAGTRAIPQVHIVSVQAIRVLRSQHRLYTIRPGDSLSVIAVHLCGHAIDWTGLYLANKRVIGPNPNLIYPRVELVVKCYDPPVQAPAVVSYGYHRVTHYRAHRAAAVVYSGTYHGSGSMEQCIIARESGGNAQVMNSTGHYGLYQFSEATWVASGGSAADFGHASVAEQRRVFASAVAARGYSDWTPYDGC